jgi:hypothetical protein
MIRLWEGFKRFYQSRIIQGIGLMVVSLALILLLAHYLASGSGLDLLRLQLLSNGTFTVSLSPWIAALFIIWALLAWWFFWPRGEPWEATEINVEVARIGKVVMRPNQEVAGIAHRAWTEVITRKAGLPFDESNDVITEVYDSWYALFTEFRSLVKSIPVEKLRTNHDAQRLCDILVQVLNEVLRPHLTTYQARFRNWYEDAVQKNPGLSPQDIQKKFPDYDLLIEDIKSTNTDFVDFAQALRRLSRRKEQEENGN